MERIDDTHDDASRLTAAWATEDEAGLWHDLARRWLGARRPECHAGSDEAGVCVSVL